MRAAGRLYAFGSLDTDDIPDSAAQGGRPISFLFARRVLGPGRFGPIFWATDAPPQGVRRLGLPSYTAMDSQTAEDIRRFVGGLLSEYVKLSPPLEETNERAIYAVPQAQASGGSVELVQLIRKNADQGLCPPSTQPPASCKACPIHSCLFASSCTVQLPAGILQSQVVDQRVCSPPRRGRGTTRR